MNTLSIIVTIVGILITLFHAMFPNLFPTIGRFLKGLKWYIWVISILLIIISGQTYFIVFKGGVL